MIHVGVCARVAVADVHLDRARIADSTVEEADTIEHGADERKLLFEAAVHHFETSVPMREVAIETHLGEAADELHGAPEVLKDGRPMGLDVKRDIVPDGGG